MSYVTLATPALWPPRLDQGSTLGNSLLDASGEKAMCILRVPATGTLDGFEVLLGTVTVAPASGLTFSFQDVDVSAVPGVPDGTADQSSTVTAGITTGGWLASGTMTRSVTRGDILACVIDFASFAAGDSLNIRRQTGLDFVSTMPYSGLYTGSWAMQTGGLAMALRYSGSVYYYVHGLAPWTSAITTSSAFGSGSTPDEYASKIVLPYGCKSTGAVVYVDSDNACDIVLYSSGGTALATSTMSPNLRNSASSVGMVVYWSEVTLAAGTYYLAVKPTSASTVLTRYMDVATAALMSATPGGTGGGIYCTRTDAGAWTETTTRRLVVQLMISEIDIGSAGGLMRHPGMTGGILG